MISFEHQVAIVTGGGRGLGRSYCIALANRGAAVVVNDIEPEFADAVADEITSAGGVATAVYDSVATRNGAQSIVNAAGELGGLHAVVNNAAIMKNGFFEELSTDDLDAVMDVSLTGSFLVTQAAWPILRAQGYGRVVISSSAGGMFASTGRANYAAAKSSLYGLCKALAFEGREHGILVNVLLPNAATTISRHGTPPGHHDHVPVGLDQALSPLRLTEAVDPMALYLASDACDCSGEAYSAGRGHFSQMFVALTRGWAVGSPAGITVEDVVDHLAEIRDRTYFGAVRARSCWPDWRSCSCPTASGSG
jgi:NAD(P)-dependent dehydrogenase (short-subunit alcohol dehydrogenase family)